MSPGSRGTRASWSGLHQAAVRKPVSRRTWRRGRELYEELGIRLGHELPLLWTQRVVSPGHATRYDGVVSDCYLLRTTHFEPRGSLGTNPLQAEGISELRRWTREELLAHRGEALFGPRNLPALVHHLLDEGIPTQPVQLGI